MNSTANKLANSNEECFHCLEKIAEYSDISVDVYGVKKGVCCYGCKAAYEYINKNQLSGFYLRRNLSRDDILIKQGSSKPTLITDWSFLDDDSSNVKYVSLSSDNKRYFNVHVQGIYCSSCSWLIDRAINNISDSININLDTNSKRLLIEVDDNKVSLEEIMLAIERVGYQPSLVELNSASIELEHLVKNENQQSLKRIVVAGLGMMQVMTYAVGIYFGDFQGMDQAQYRFLTLVSMLIATVVVFYSGKPFFRNAWNDIKNRHLGMDVPIAIAIGGAYFPSVYQILFRAKIELQGDIYFDSAVMFIFFLSVGRYIEMRARHRLSDAPNAINRLLPPSIKVFRNNNNVNSEVRIQPSEIQIGDRMNLGERQTIPFDAIVVKGEALIDEAFITGESQAISRLVGDKVIAGSLVVNGDFVIEATSAWLDSSVKKIESLLNKAKLSNKDDNELLQKIAQKFVSTILVVTVAVAIIWWFIDPSKVFEIVLAMLVASCPCAFSLAAPTGFAAASYVLRLNGLLLANFHALKLLPKVSVWCFDKTGTITQGQPTIVDVKKYQSNDIKACMQVAAALSAQSNHVLASAFSSITYANQAIEFKHVIGQGVSAKIDGETYYLGSPNWVLDQANVYDVENINNDLSTHKQYSVVALANKDKYLVSFFIQDKVRSNTDEAIKFIQSKGKQVFIISGDGQSVVESATGYLNVDRRIGNLLPEEKLKIVTDLQSRGQIVAMLGDGVNDAPVISQADVSIAMSSGSELSTSQADIIIINGDLGSLKILDKVALKMKNITRQNLTWALLYNVIVLPLAAFGLLTPWIAALGMSISSLFVVLNASRIGNNNFKKE